MRAKLGIIEKVGPGCTTTPPGSCAARNVESTRSSEPHPVATVEGATDHFAATAARRSSA